MKTPKLILTCAVAAAMFSPAFSQDGEQLFRSNCASCHAFGKKLVGPDLTGIHEKRDEQWLLKWIKSSQTLVREGDATAVQVFNENNKIPMPDAYINEEEIKSVLAFIETKGSGVQAAVPAANMAIAEPVVREASGTLLTLFSFTEYLLMGLMLLLLLVIWVLTRSIRSLSAQVAEKYNGEH